MDAVSVPDPDEDWGDPPLDERRARLDGVVASGALFAYTYDFGDYWRHRVEVEKIVPVYEVGEVPACVDGGARPPEDCGGTRGYEELVDILADPSHRERDARLDGSTGRSTPNASTATISPSICATSGSRNSTTSRCGLHLVPRHLGGRY